MCMGRKMKANKSMLFASIIIMILCQISTVNSENTGFQEQPGFNEKRVLSFDRPTLFMFGEQTAGPVMSGLHGIMQIMQMKVIRIIYFQKMGLLCLEIQIMAVERENLHLKDVLTLVAAQTMNQYH